MKNLTVYATLALSIISLIATFSGMLMLFNDQESLVSPYIYAFLFTTAIQSMLVYSVMKMKSGRGLKWRYAAVYVLSAAISVGFGYLWWYGFLSADQYVADTNQKTIQSIETSLAQAMQGLEDFEHNLEALKGYSESMQARERSHGRTCGDGSPKGAGPRQRLRDEDARLFASLQASLQPLLDRTKDAFEEYQEAVVQTDIQSPEALDKVYQRIRPRLAGLAQHPTLLGMYTTLKDRQGVHNEGWTNRGRHYRCPDPVLDQRITAILNFHFPSLPEARFVYRNDQKALLARAFTLMWQLPGKLLDSTPNLIAEAQADRVKQRREMLSESREVALSDDGAFKRDYLPLFFGSLVDVLILLAAPPGVSSRPFGWLTKKGLNKKVTKRLERFIGRPLNDLVDILREYVWRENKEAVVVLPSPPRTAEEKALSRIMEAIEDDDLLHQGPANVRIDKVPQHMLDRINAISPQPQQLIGYRFSPNGYLQLERLLAASSSSQNP